MLRERLKIAQEVADQLADAERRNDMALAATARLAATMLEARMQLNVAAQVGQPAFSAVASTFERQASSRQLLVDAHEALNDTRRFVGLQHYMIGGGGDKQVPPSIGALHLVETSAA